MQHSLMMIRRASLLLAAVLLLTTGDVGLAASKGASYEGASVPMGRGTARVIVRADASGKPISIAAMLSAGALEGLPTEPNKNTRDGYWPFPLPMPARGPKTGYTHVVIDWNPHGHPPPDVYTVPHFDIHFYVMSADKVGQIAFTGADDPATKVSDAALIPDAYQVVPDTAVDKMGVHAIDTNAPEFNGKPFTATFIYGYYKGELTFLEPMIARAFLSTKPDLTLSVRTPPRYSSTAYYPTTYSVRYDAARDVYLVELGNLKYWGKAASAGAAK